MNSIPADNLYHGTTHDEFVDSAAKQLAGMVFDLWLEYVDKEDKQDKQDKQEALLLGNGGV